MIIAQFTSSRYDRDDRARRVVRMLFECRVDRIKDLGVVVKPAVDQLYVVRPFSIFGVAGLREAFDHAQ
jgi:hypothetical protein